MTTIGLALFLLAALVVLGLPVVVMTAASRGGPNLARIATAVAGAAIVIASFVAVLTVLGLGGDSTSVTVPVSEVPVRVPSGITLDGMRTTITSGGFDRVTVTATGLTIGTRLVMAASVLLYAATAIVVAMVVLRLVRSTRADDPFALGSRALITTGWVVLVGGVLATWVGNIGDWLASRELFEVHGWGGTVASADVTDLSQLGWPDPAFFRLDLPWAPLAIAIVLALLAAVFRHGQRLRRDTEGLV